MRPLLLQLRNQALGFLREPTVAVFNILVPFSIVLVQALAFGDDLIGDDLPGYRIVDALPVNAGVIFTMIVGLFGMGVGLASMIESRTLAGSSLRPRGAGTVLLAYGLVLLVMSMSGWLLSVLALALGWQIKAPSSPVVAVLAMSAGVAMFLSLGALIAALSGTPRSAQGVCSAIFFPLLFLSGAVFPVDTYPAALIAVARWLPGYRFNELLAPTWIAGQDFDWVSLTYCLIATVVFAILATRSLGRREDV
jgi:ABC-2 type transport system permease protein